MKVETLNQILAASRDEIPAPAFSTVRKSNCGMVNSYASQAGVAEHNSAAVQVSAFQSVEGKGGTFGR